MWSIERNEKVEQDCYLGAGKKNEFSMSLKYKKNVKKGGLWDCF